MATEHPKITVYIPKEILKVLDDWKRSNDIKSRSEAIVRILGNYLEVPHRVPQQGTAELEAALSTVLKELSQLHERVAALEESISTANDAVPSAAPTDAGNVHTSNVLEEVLSTVLVEGTELSDEALSTVPSTALNVLAPQLPAVLTQSALAKRLGCSDKAVEKHRKQSSKESFTQWSRTRDPDNVAWTWEGTGGRGQPLRFLPQE